MKHIECPHCHELNSVDVTQFKEFPVYNARDICGMCGNEFGFEIAVVYHMESFALE